MSEPNLQELSDLCNAIEKTCTQIEGYAHEGDKVMCGTGNIRGLLARFYPQFKREKPSVMKRTPYTTDCRCVKCGAMSVCTAENPPALAKLIKVLSELDIEDQAHERVMEVLSHYQ